jgi:hypothetical protein
MKVLIDECAPRALKSFVSKHGHDSLTVQEAAWSGKQNGELLAEAETEFGVLAGVAGYLPRRRSSVTAAPPQRLR